MKGSKGSIVVTMRHAISLITARLSFFGQRSEPDDKEASDVKLSDEAGLYLHEGKVWKTRSHKEVPSGNHSLTDVQTYVRELPHNRVVDYTDPSLFPQYKSMTDFVTTVRVACEAKGSAFKWPKAAYTASSSFSVALTHMPPGYMVSLANAALVPVHMQRPSELKRSQAGSGSIVGEAPAVGGGNQCW